MAVALRAGRAAVVVSLLAVIALAWGYLAVMAGPTIEPIKNPVTGAAHRALIELPMGNKFNLAEVASGTTRAAGAVPLELDKSHAHLVYNRMSSAGIATQ